MKRHYGVTNMGARVVVIFMQLPEDQTHCLAVDIHQNVDNIVKDELMEIIDSDEGQRTPKIHDLLHRRRSQTGVSILEALHRSNMIKRYPTSDIIMTPDAQTKIPLSELNSSIRKMAEGNSAVSDEQLAKERNAHIHNMNAVQEGQKEIKVRNLLFEASELEAQAEMFINEARKKRTAAEALIPSKTTENLNTSEAPKRSRGRPKNV